MEPMFQLVGMKWRCKFNGCVKGWRPEEIAWFISTLMRVSAGTASFYVSGTERGVHCLCSKHTAGFGTDFKMIVIIMNNLSLRQNA